jgi:segregation and condensation protein B
MEIEKEIIDSQQEQAIEAQTESQSAEVAAPEETRLEGEWSESDKLSLLEALVLTHGEPIGLDSIRNVTGMDEEEISALLQTLKARCQEQERGFELVEVGTGYQFRTQQRFARYICNLKASKPRRLSAPALETLAIVAYRQPVIKSDVEKLRGVDATPTLKTLLDRGLIRIVGHQSSAGTPALYGTTDEFLKIFGLKSLGELPRLRDLKEMDDPGESGEMPEQQQLELAAEEEQASPA